MDTYRALGTYRRRGLLWGPLTTRAGVDPSGVGDGALNLHVADPTGFAGATKYKKPGFTVGAALLF